VSKLSLAHYARNLKLLERNREWWQAGSVTPGEKAAYYGSLVRTYATRGKVIRYLGNDLHFDNPATPLNLQNYPYEITRKVLRNMAITPTTVLDIGANLGQFSLTTRHVLGAGVAIDAFEPNPFVFDFLRRNTRGVDGVTIHNYGVGAEDGESEIHFDPSRTGIGSIIKANAGEPTESAVITITGDVAAVTGRSDYDLVKVDVEGYEFHTLEGLAGITPRYLFLEVSGLGREKDYRHSELFARIRQQWGEFDLSYIGAYGDRGDTFDVLVEFGPAAG
jgi:FkbM family methyltransferase